MKKIIGIFLYIFVVGNIIDADIINTFSFNNEMIGQKYVKTKSSYQTIMSNDKKNTAINESCERILIIDDNERIIFKFEWNDEIKIFPKSDAVYIFGWSNDSNYLWFFTYIPSEINYIAKVNINDKTLILYDTKMTDMVSHFVFNYKNEKLYYDNYFPYNDENQYIEHSIYEYNIETKEEKLFYKRKGGTEFNLRMEDGEISYNK